MRRDANGKIRRMSSKERDDLHYLWDGSEDWCLWRSDDSQVSVKVVFESGRPTLKEMVALRQVVDDLRDLPTSQVKAMVCDQPEFHLGVFGTDEGHFLREEAQLVGLNAVLEDASSVSFSIINCTSQSSLLIEDEQEHEYAVQKMLEAGRPVIDVPVLE